MVNIRKAYDEYKPGYVSEKLFLDTSGCVVQQHERDKCDINMIMARYERSGVIDHYNKYQGRYEDVCDVQDYSSCLRNVIAAEDCFMSLPAKLRSQFDNDPGKFFDFALDPSNAEAMASMGLSPAPEGVHEGVAKSAVADAEAAPKG